MHIPQEHLTNHAEPHQSTRKRQPAIGPAVRELQGEAPATGPAEQGLQGGIPAHEAAEGATCTNPKGIGIQERRSRHYLEVACCIDFVLAIFHQFKLSNLYLTQHVATQITHDCAIFFTNMRLHFQNSYRLTFFLVFYFKI